MNTGAKASSLAELFLSFLKIGAFTFGGGYSMIPLILAEVTEKKKWISENEMLDIIAISESTPGPIAINTASFLGYRRAGLAGSIVSTLGVVLPAFVIIFALSFFYGNLKENIWFGYVFQGIRIGVLYLLLSAVVKLIKKCPRHPKTYILAALALVLSVFAGLNAVIIIIGAAVFGIFADPRGKTAKPPQNRTPPE